MTPEAAIETAIENVILDGLDDVFPRPPELEFLREPPFRQVVTELVRRSLSGGMESLAVGPIQHANVPKSGMYAFRRCAIVQPMDHIKYLSLALLVADDIESARQPATDARVHSYRFAPSGGRLFDPAFSYGSFHEAARRRAASGTVKVVVKCDIANFYDRLNLHRLESTLHTLSTNRTAIRALNELLLYWAKKDSYGLPVGSNASRILAEAALIEMDRYLVSIGADFIRFVDDYQFFAPDMTKAQFWLYKTMDRLAQEGLSLNSYKTRVIESKVTSTTRIQTDDPSRDVVRFKPVRPIMLGHSEPDENGFYVRVPRRFVLPDTGELTMPPRRAFEICRTLLAKNVVEPAEFREFAISMLVFHEYQYLLQLPGILTKHPPYIDYATGMLHHLKDKAPAPIREQLASALGEFLCSPTIEIPEWHKIQIISLLGTNEYQNKDALLHVLRNVSRNSGPAIGRAVFDALYNFATRGDALEIKEFFERSDPSEKRAILRILNKVLPDEEKKAWCKYAGHQLRDDPFAVHFVKPYKAKPPTGTGS